MNNSTIQIVGNVANDIQFNTSSEGLPYANFRVASTERKLDKETSRWVDGDTSWFTVTCFRSLAENVVASIKKGDPVIVAGKLTVRTWEKEDRSGTSVEIIADLVGHDLARGTAMFSRNPKAVPVESSTVAA